MTLFHKESKFGFSPFDNIVIYSLRKNINDLPSNNFPLIFLVCKSLIILFFNKVKTFS